MIINPYMFGVTYTSRTTAFATATGISDATILGALNTLDLGLISNSLDAKIYYYYPIVGASATKHSYNFINTATYQATWSGGITHNSTGALSNGTTGYGATGFNPYVAGFNPNSFAFGFYSHTSITATSTDMGYVFSGSSRSEINSYIAGNWYMSNCSAYTAGTAVTTTKFLLNSRTSSPNFAFYRDGSLVSTITQASTSAANNNMEMYILAVNGNAKSLLTQSSIICTTGLTSGEASTLNSLITTFETALGRNV